MVSIVGKRIQTGMSFNSHDSDDADSDQGNPSDGGSHEGGSEDLILPYFGGNWEMKKVNTVWVGCVLIVVTLALLFVTAIIVTFECRGGPDMNSHAVKYYGVLCYVPSMSMIMYLQSVVWGLFLISDQYIQYEHIKARRRGYLDFYNETRTLSQLPFFIVSAWCAFLLAVAMVLNDNCLTEDKCGKSVHFGKAEYALLCVGLEGGLIILSTAFYIHKVFKFNKSQPLPDVLREEYMSMATDYNPNSAGLVDEEIFQRQADVIRYLSEHNVILRRKVMELNGQLMDHSHSVA